MDKANNRAILVDRLVKNFTVKQKGSGLRGSLSYILAPKKKTVRALRSISFSLAKGELVGFIGPNGAGKTTTLKVLSGLLYPTSGFAQVLGFDPCERKTDYLKNISLVLGQKNQLWWDLPAKDSFDLNAAIYEIPKSEYKKSLDELTKLLEVKSLLKTQVRRLSLGQRMRLELVAALLHKPKILFLDEPTIGLDVIGQQKIRDFFFEYNKTHNATIMLTSHNMDDLIDLARRVIVIDKGKILFDGELKQMVAKFAKKKIIKVDLAKDADIKGLEKIGKLLKFDFPQATIEVDRKVAAVAAAELLQNMPVVDLEITEEPIDEIIRKVFSGELKRTKR